MSNKSPKKSSQTSQHHPETIGPWQLLKTIGKGSSACRFITLTIINSLIFHSF